MTHKLRYLAVFFAAWLTIEAATGKMDLSYYTTTAPLWGYLAYLGVLVWVSRSVRALLFRYAKRSGTANPDSEYTVNDSYVAAGLTEYIVANLDDDGLDGFIASLSDEGLLWFEKALEQGANA